MNRFLIVLTVSLLLIFPTKIAWAYSCINEHSPLYEANSINKNDLVIKGKVLKIKRPSFWTQQFSDNVFSTAIVEPIDVYKGVLNSPVQVVNTLYKQDKIYQKNASILKPASPALNEGQTYTLALEYDEHRKAYVKQDVCGKLPEFKFLYSLKKIEKIEGVSVDPNDTFISTLKNCSMYFSDKEITYRYYSDSLKIGFKEIVFDEPVTLIARNDDSMQPLEAIYFKTRKDDFLAVGKYENTYFYFLDCLD